MSQKLKYLQPEQYASWLKKVDDPDWTNHRYRDAKDSAMISAIRELRDARADNKALLEENEQLRGMMDPMLIGARTLGTITYSPKTGEVAYEEADTTEHSEPQ